MQRERERVPETKRLVDGSGGGPAGWGGVGKGKDEMSRLMPFPLTAALAATTAISKKTPLSLSVSTIGLWTNESPFIPVNRDF